MLDPSTQYESIKSIFMRVMEVDDPNRRRALIEQSCGPDSAKCRAVEELLAAYDGRDSNVLDQAVDRLLPSDRPGMIDSLGVTFTTAGSSPDRVRNTPATIDQYKIFELIGEGGMGTVYVAQQQQPVRRKVAIKVIRAGIATQSVLARFSAERQALAMMDHPNIAKIYDGGTMPSGQPYLVMELVQGLPITEYANQNQLSTADRLKLMVKVCRAVQHAHGKAVLHRDLKPSNILVAEIDGEAIPKVIDFGLAKTLEEPLTENTIYTAFSQMIGTPMYMSPEQAAMGVVDVDTRSDVYSLGVLLYELLVGVPPYDRELFRSAGFDEVRRMIRDVNPAKPSVAVDTIEQNLASTVASHRHTDPRTLKSTLSGELDWIVMKSLEKDRNRRYESASELAEDIRRFLSQEPVRAGPPSKLYHCRKFLSRNLVAMSVAAIVLAALVITTGVSAWQVMKVRQAKLASELREQHANDLLEAIRMQSAIRSFRRGELGRLTQQLDEWQLADTSAGLANLLQSAAVPEPVWRMSHSAPIHNLDVATDGSTMVAVDSRGDVTLWQLNERGESGAATHLGSHGEQADSVAIAPDGTRAVTGSRTGWLIFWDLKQASEIERIRPLSTGIETVCWTPDGRSIAAGARYSEAWVGDADGNEILRVANDQRHEALLFSPDSRELYLPTRSGIDVWGIEPGEKLRSIDTRPLSNVRTLCFAGENQEWLVAGDRFSELLLIFDRRNGEMVGQVESGAPYARSLDVSPTGMWLAAGYTDGQVYLIELSKGHNKRVTGEVRFQFQAHRTEDDSRLPLRWVGDKDVVTAAVDGTIKRWSVSSVSPWRTINQPDDRINNVLVVAKQAEPIVLFYEHLRPTEFARQRNQNIVYPLGVTCAEAADGLVSFVQGNQISIVAVTTGEILAVLSSDISQLIGSSLSTDANVLLVYDDSQIEVWKTSDRWQTHRKLRSFRWQKADHTAPSLADGGRTIIADDAQHDRTIELDVESGQIVKEYGDSRNPDAICVSQNGLFLARSDFDRIQVFDRQSGERVMDCQYPSEPDELAFFSNDRILLSAHDDGSVRATHLPTSHMLGVLYQPEQAIGPVIALQIAPEGDRIAVTYHTPQTAVVVILGR